VIENLSEHLRERTDWRFTSRSQCEHSVRK
jgi:hypothetical protein